MALDALTDSIFAASSSRLNDISFFSFLTFVITLSMEIFEARETSCAGNKSFFRKE
jgi:hypothetical protein